MKKLNLVLFLIIVFMSVLIEFLKFYIDLNYLKIIFIFNYLILIPLYVLYNILNKRFLWMMIFLYFLPLPIRFIVPSSVLVKMETNRLEKVSIRVMNIYNLFKNDLEMGAFNWKLVKELDGKRFPHSWFDFKQYNLELDYNKNLLISTNEIKLFGKKIYLSFNSQDNSIRLYVK